MQIAPPLSARPFSRFTRKSAPIIVLALLSLAACGRDRKLPISPADLSFPIDPVCKMDVSKLKIAATAAFESKTYGFCSVECKEAFEKEPQKYVQK